MITVAIAVRDTAAARQYRALLIDSGIDAHFASDIPTLIRLVKGRPIDVVIYDLARNALSINSWLVEVERDRDLALAPILWIGAGILPEMKRVVEEYRPGMHLPSLPALDDLKTAINTLIGRIPPVPVKGGTQSAEPVDDPIWKPGESNIEDALSIFAEGGKPKLRSSTPATPKRPEENIPFPPSRQAPPQPQAPSVGPAPAPSQAAAPTPSSGALSNAELDSIAERISARLAGDLLKRLNRDDLRRMVEQALAEASVPTA